MKKGYILNENKSKIIFTFERYYLCFIFRLEKFKIDLANDVIICFMMLQIKK